MSIILWPFRPDWAGGVLERLEWLTDLMASTKGAEQRRPQRLTPRRTFEATFLPHGRQRTLFDLYVSAKGNDDWYIPLWFDVDTLRRGIGEEETALDVPYEDREFTKGGLAVLRPPTSADHDYHTFTHEIVKIVKSANKRLIVLRGQAGTEVRAWPPGTEMYPIRKARFAEQPQTDVVTASIVSTNFKFAVTEPNEYMPLKQTSGYDYAYGQAYGRKLSLIRHTPALNLGMVETPSFMPDFEGFKVMNSEPDFNQDLGTSYDRLINTLDNRNGIPLSYDSLGYTTPGQKHTWFLKGRAEQGAYRTMLYFLRGRVRPVWVPTFADDVQLIAPALAGTNWIDIAAIDYTKLSSTLVNRQVLAIQKNDGTWLFKRIIHTGESLDPEVKSERFELHEDFEEDLKPEDIYKISFMAVARLDQDAIEINHETDNMGLAKSKTVFRVQPELRQYQPWAASWPPTWRACERACASMPRVQEDVGFGLPGSDWKIEDVIDTVEYSQRMLALGDSQRWWSDEPIYPDEYTQYFGWALNFGFGSAGYYYKPDVYLSSFRMSLEGWKTASRDTMELFMSSVLIPEALADVEDWTMEYLRDYYLRRQLFQTYQSAMETVWSFQAFHKRNWLPMRLLTRIPQSCKNDMLGKFCVQSIYTRSPIDRFPTNARGSHTIYGAGVMYHLDGVDEANWPTDLSLLGQSYTHTVMPYNGNGLHHSCGCLCLQFVEEHTGLRTAVERPIDQPENILWWHRAQISWLTPAAWPEKIRLFMYESLTGALLRTLDLDIINIPVTAYGDEFERPVWDVDEWNEPEPTTFSANLVVFRKTYGREEGQTAFHADPWDGIWNVVPINSKGFIVEVYERK